MTDAVDIVMPRLSDSMEEGTVLRWLKAVGDDVAVGEDLVEIETDKANMVYESDTAGVIVEIVAAEGQTLPVGAPIARVGSGDAKPAPPAVPATAAPQPEHSPKPEPSPAPTHEADVPGARVKASPIARRIARDLGIDLATIQGSGPGGRVVKADVENRAGDASGGAEAGRAPSPAEAASAKGEVQVLELDRLQRTISRRMAESKATAPHFYLEAVVDMTEAVAARDGLERTRGGSSPLPTLNDMIVRACAIALREMPRVNGAYRDGRVETYSRVNVGIAVATEEALVVPTVFDADALDLSTIAETTHRLAARVRDGSITPPELSGGTFTVSNLGMLGVDAFSAVINPPQAAILAVGAVRPSPQVTEDGAIEARETMRLNLACDHRILYGADGARFLARVRELLEAPLSLAV